MSKLLKRLTKAIKVEIYETEYRVNIYDDKITVFVPFIHWVNQSGSLDFTKTKIVDDKIMGQIKNAESDEMAMHYALRQADEFYLYNNPIDNKY